MVSRGPIVVLLRFLFFVPTPGVRGGGRGSGGGTTVAKCCIKKSRTDLDGTGSHRTAGGAHRNCSQAMMGKIV